MCHSRRHHRPHRERRSRTWPDETRAADADRDATVDALRDHAAAGRLESDELDERLETALRGRTLGELRALVADLPGPSPSLGPRPARRERSSARGAIYANAWWAVPLGVWGALSIVH
jgi:Domain of unknown function (DUF1707)